MLPNYDSIPIGQTGGLEGGAFVARADDDASNWFNPAGLSRATTSSISSSAGTYQLLSLTHGSLPDTGGYVQQVPALVGILVKSPFGGERSNAALLFVRTNSWVQQTESEVSTLSGGLSRLFTYSSDSLFTRVEGSFGMSYANGGPWRFGAALAGVYTYLRAVQSTANRVVDSTGLESVEVSDRKTGEIGHGRLAAGVQYDLSPEIRLGALIRSPGFAVIRSGSYNFDGLDSDHGSAVSVSFFDKDIRFNYKLPWELVLGAAYVRDAFRIELDVKGYTGISKYNLFETTKQALIITTDAEGQPVIVTAPVQNVAAEAKAVLNVALGGHVYLSQNKIWKLHVGFNTDASPVGSADEFFDHVNLYAVTLGLSGETRHIVGSLGIQYAFGSGTAPLTDVTSTKLTIDSIGVLYSLGFRF